ncbi:RNA polymerase sigma factor [Homoserinibacter sp. YIM 151385]|uniref:RNA polymerase sigma factor n=1 Tax=Homoserinibacter sp. YIM 151385 TaxID=2985506 RepID=UPI0022F0B7CA|nr:sigma-70 family RNA polymerase sigma factor [Homoserinibacter sp. YIM 151385]WBU36972.1 sigma-70 family RNA polymerase sigma factor [Homoserinibacter sp. YIM 151385]
MSQRGAEAGAEQAAASARRRVEAVWRIESARIVATLTRVTGDFGLAEDLAQEALLDALAQWPRDGVPANPGAWLTAVAKRRAIDLWRRRERLDARLAAIAHDLEEGQRRDPEAAPWDPDEIQDDVLRLVFIACHPVLSREAQVALTLRVVGGLTSEEIGRAFMIPTATVQQRIVRAKRTLAAAHVPVESPPREEHRERLASVLGVVYLIFNEGYAATSGPDWMRPELALEAVRLARVLASLVPGESEVHGLLALLELQSSRFAARVTREGEPVLLGDQDRRRWDRGAIARGRAALARADALGRGRGAFALQAGIAECHAVAASTASTDWEQIVVLYEALGRIAPSPVVELNRAVAVSMATGPASALRIVEELERDGSLAGTAMLPSVRGELLAQLGRREEAVDALAEAARRVGNERERDVLLGKVRALEEGAR